MELALHNWSSMFVSFSRGICKYQENREQEDMRNLPGFNGSKLLAYRRKVSRISSMLPEAVVSVAVAATVVGAAATILVKRAQESEKGTNQLKVETGQTTPTQTPVKVCEDCGGSGICPECKGEGFVVQKLPEENAERARMTSKNAATRYTSG
ncbi:hypothetical protein Cgig2_006406 [Carnegiea gigantea]|uniref:DUF7895 domain-containing protein n=1 Tax=Carnegiea gigantea TaxID=171969 RepID=A0A9Q1K615_9CARY|nr:hypothetical protein Cgig2_006406 [Carnegiea gigantea]